MKKCCKCKKEIKFENKKYCKDCKKLIDALYYQKNKNTIRKKQTKYRNSFKLEINKKRRENYLINCETIKNRNKLWQKNNKELKKQLDKNYQQKNKYKISARMKKYQKERCLNDIEYKITRNLRRRIWGALFKNLDNKSKTTIDLLGCSPKQLKEHLEIKFKDGMSWDNYGVNGWHVDHIKPCASFDLTDSEQQKECFHYSNLQPLWAEENLKKGAK